MDGGRFDVVARLSATGMGRRTLARSLAAGLLGGAGLPALAERAAAKPGRRKGPKSGRRGVVLFERLAATLERETGDCAALAAAAVAFQQQHQRVLQEILAEEATWSATQRRAAATRDRARITAAAQSLHTMLASCGFRGAVPSPICLAGDGEPAPRPGVVACPGGCDCSCICPLSAGDCAEQSFACIGGSRDSCCWFGTCVDGNCSSQCVNCCDLPPA